MAHNNALHSIDNILGDIIRTIFLIVLWNAYLRTQIAVSSTDRLSSMENWQARADFHSRKLCVPKVPVTIGLVAGLVGRIKSSSNLDLEQTKATLDRLDC